ncbi:RNA-binding protein with serine-rich domain 1 [Galemys pyrenaicus]|uniref:RNA-binding protein with serine-rich domain 1 n=1 Tax=Galemys pyrenaicus TaxID=202257 RepID=A0A8J5ZIY8_GALPY|nr:RNA-binding protein with serine-rich domain 1 [Galemys pyrenaicus]
MDLSGVKKKSLLGVKENNKKSSTRAPSPTKRKDRSDEKSKDRSKDKGATKESSEKDRGRDKTRKRRSASSGSSSTRSRSSSTSSSGSSTSTGSSSGSSSSSASSRSGSSSTSRSSSSSSSSGSPSPSRRRHDNRRRSRSKSKPPKRDEKERKRRSPSPKPTKVHIGRLTRNVTKDHIMEIFSTYGKIKMIDMPVERMHPHLSKGYAYVEFENPDEAEKALKHMDGGERWPFLVSVLVRLQLDPFFNRTNRWPGDHRDSCAGPLASATPQAIQPSEEDAASTSHVAPVTPTDEETVTLPSAQVPCAPALSLTRPPPPQEPLQLQLLPIGSPAGRPRLCPAT